MQGNQENKLSMWQKFSYGVGNLGNCFIYIVVTSYILFYCTNVVGVAAGVIGTLMMIARIFDGVTDVFMGRIIDVTKSKLGKARFWYLISIVPLGICMYLIFNIPGTFTNSAKYTWIFIVYLLISAVFYTMNYVAYTTLVALTTRDQKDQVTMSSMSMFFGMAGAMVITSFTPNAVAAFGGGQKGWQMVSIIYAVVGCLIMLIPFFTLKELPEEAIENNESVEVKVEERISFLQTVKELATNKYFLLILALYLVGYINTGINSTIGIYYATYVLNNASLLGVIGLAGMISMFIGLPFMPKIIEKFGMRKSNIAGAIITTIGFAVACVSRFAGLGILILGMFIKGLGTVPGAATYSPLLSKTVDYNYLKTGHRITGSIFSCASVGTKIGTGLGTAMCGWLLDAAAFDGQAAVQSGGANNMIFILYLAIPTVISLITIWIYLGMDVEEKVARMRKGMK